jgi:hypothetical protein
MLMMTLPSHASDGATESAWQWRCEVLLVMALSSSHGDDAM